MKKTLLLDIDGVICPLGLLLKSENYIKVSGGWNKGYIREKVVEWIRDIQQEFDVIWCSSWESETENITEKLGIKPFPYLGVNSGRHSYHWYKLDEIEKNCVENPKREIICVDDAVDEQALLNFEIPENLKFFKPANPLTGLSNTEMTDLSGMA